MFFCTASFLHSRCVSMGVFIGLSIYQSFYLKQQITITTIFIRRPSRHRSRHSLRAITSIRQCTLKRCSMITVQGCWPSSYIFSLFFSACSHAHTLVFFPLSHPCFISQIFGAKTKKHSYNRVKPAFISSSLPLFLNFSFDSFSLSKIYLQGFRQSINMIAQIYTNYSFVKICDRIKSSVFLQAFKHFSII